MKKREDKKLLRVLGVKKRDGRIWVERRYNGTQERQDTKIPIQPFVVEPAYVNYSAGVTLNMGNYQSARIDVGISLPTYIEEIPDAYKQAIGIVDKVIEEEVNKLKNSTSNGGGGNG